MIKPKDYDLKKAVNRLLWRFNLKKGFTPNEEDKNALNLVLEWINSEKEINIHERAVKLFAKLYIYNLDQFIRHYDTDVLDDKPQKELSRVLNIDLELFYDSFMRNLRLVQMGKICERAKKPNGEPITIDELKDIYTEGFVRDELNHMITEALNRFK